MPTAISTTTTTTITSLDNHSNIQLRSSSASSSPRRPKQSLVSKSGAQKATLRVLYERAKHAFLQRDLLLANELLTQAFLQLGPPPPSHGERSETDADSLDSQRRKWDILRITLHTTLYTSQASDPRLTSASAPSASHFNPAALPPYQFLQGLYSQSLGLFNPANTLPSIGKVPDQVVLLLVVSAVKLGEVHLAKEWVEDWLVRRDVSSAISTNLTTGENVTPTSYERIVDVYILHVLPRLGLWDDATEFMRYESEMNEGAKERMIQALNAQHSQHTNESRFPNRRHSRSRSTSPTPSLASSISSSGTISASAAHAPSRPASAASISSSASTATVRPSRPQQTNAPFATPIVGNRSFSMTSLSTPHSGMANGMDTKGVLGAAVGNGHVTGSNGDTGFPKDGKEFPLRDVSKSSGSVNGTIPLPIPPLYRNPKSDQSMAPTGTVLSRRMTSIVPFIQYYTLSFYLRLARILNERFNLDLPVDFDFPLPERPISTLRYKPNMWHIVLVFLPLILIFRRASRGPGSQHGGAGDMARLKLRAQQTNRNLAIGPYLGVGFWKAAVRAVGDAVSMGGRGLI